ncbi:hypothetical protein [Variovorax sp. Sphag1AA]|uniref:hypothetical protein n=1 Tax=Variovorax sp. Sphag1AA TaxID=2587027 RepID=UPI00160A882F|nr:hypothetical protein [Variovorax sp. Sphag1AA]MBB3176353.1 hypothetical protein [Variovorax sp. Sphag1AA]
MTTQELMQKLATLEERHEDLAARLMVCEGMLAAVVRSFPQAASAIGDFKVHQDYLEAASLNSSGVTDSWIAKLRAAREVMLFRLSIDAKKP